ncbi:DUF6884 domain-containing protein [Haladaptatus sp. DFWS20]|uniref:DUF6884 domain-containing protein n=1 Tax=Haladaptatus sp. DFWS20 TaxID=3403467 RepID=UPI003EB71CA6
MRSLAIVNGSEEQRGGWRPAREQYNSAQFDMKTAYAETCDDWRLISEKHVLFSPNARIGPDEITLDDFTPVERSEWARQIRVEIKRLVLDDGEYDELVVLLDAEFVRCLAPLWDKLEQCDIRVNLELTERSGSDEQQKWLRQATDRHSGTSPKGTDTNGEDGVC